MEAALSAELALQEWDCGSQCHHVLLVCLVMLPGELGRARCAMAGPEIGVHSLYRSLLHQLHEKPEQ